MTGLNLSSRQTQTEDLAVFRENNCLEDTVFSKLASEMSCKINRLAEYVKVYSLSPLKAGTDFTIAILMGRQEEVFWF